MNPETNKKFELPGKNREKLLALEKEGKYVFHGSPEQIEILEPRQAEKINKKTGEMEKYGEPAIYATVYAETAIFRALINAKDVIGDSESSFGMNESGLHFSTTKNLLEAAKKKVGKVYVLDRQKFSNFRGMQCESNESITPLDIVEVSFDDLPNNIETL